VAITHLHIDIRHRLVDALTAPDTLGFGIHFTQTQFGRVVRDGDTLAWNDLS
jgi:hypothetical protein